MSDSREKANHVNTWLRQAARGLSSEQLLQLSEIAMSALWKRSYLTLGELTLVAVMDRVVCVGAETFPLLSTLKVTPSGIDWQELYKQRNSFNEAELTEGIEFVIAEFMVVVNNLTAEFFLSAFQAELSKVSLESPAIGGKQEDRRS